MVEIRDPVHGNMMFSFSEMKIIDSFEFSRLRTIKQLGFSEYSFPGATHNRFLHSLGVCHLAGKAFHHIFSQDHFSSNQTKERLFNTLRLASLLHDVGHGPLSHAVEEVMPAVCDLKLPYGQEDKIHASHEDYTIKYLLDSQLSLIIKKEFPDVDLRAIATLIEERVDCHLDYFIDQGLDYKPILRQLVSSELDVDRMDYLVRDSYFCGTNYGQVELEWLMSNLSFHIHTDRVHLALNKRAIYAFDDFLISRHHMHLMVYFHHKSIVYEEMLFRYLISDDCHIRLPSDIDEYTKWTDRFLFHQLSEEKNDWANRIISRRPYKRLLEKHVDSSCDKMKNIETKLNEEGISTILASSQARLSKYHTSFFNKEAGSIFVVDSMFSFDQAITIEQSTEIFKKYEHDRIIERLYVEPDSFQKAQKIIGLPIAFINKKRG